MLFLFCICFYQLFEDKATVLFHCVGAGWNFFSPWHSRVWVMWRFTRILKKKKWVKLEFSLNCPFLWFCLELLDLSVGLRGRKKTVTITLRQCKTIPNSKLQTSCYKDRFMGVPLMNLMPFGGNPERLVIDYHRSDLNASLRLLARFFFSSPKCQSLKLYHNSFVSLAKQFWPQTKFQTTRDDTFLWMTFCQPAYLFATNVFLFCFFERAVTEFQENNYGP